MASRANLPCALLIVLSVAMNSACDGYIGVEGRVFEVANQEGASSVVMVDALEQVLPPRLTPVSGAEVVVEPWKPEQRASLKHRELWTQRTTTDASGYFKTGTTTKPGKYDATITVRCSGFEEVQRVFRHDRFEHQAVVVLVRQAK
jgi:hypothetical protein